MPEKVLPGQLFKPKAATWNRFVDATRDKRTQPIDARSQTAEVYVENRSGSDLARFAALGIDGVTIPHANNSDEFFRHIVLEGSTPTFASDHVGKFVVLLEPAKNNGFARCAMSGLVQVQVNVTDADHEWCDVANSDNAKLTSYGAGSARIVHKPSGTGTKWCVVNLAQSYGPAREYTGLINDASGFATTDATTAMDGLEAVDGVPVLTALATVQNIHGWAGDDNAEARARYNHELKRWELVMVDCQ